MALEDGRECCDNVPYRRMRCSGGWPLGKHKQGIELVGEGESKWSDGSNHNSGEWDGTEGGEEWRQEGRRRGRPHCVD